MTTKNVTNDDIMTTLNAFANQAEKRFESMDKRMSNIEFSQIRMADDINEIKQEQQRMQKNIDRIYTILDAHMKHIDELLQEKAVKKHQYERMESWIFQLADKLDVKLKYEA